MGEPERRLQRGLQLATVAIAAVHLFVLNLPAMLAHAPVYRSLVAEVVAFVVVGVVLGRVADATWRERSLGRSRWLLLAALLGAEVTALAGIPPAHLTGVAEWTFGIVCWVGMLLLLDHGFVAVAGFLVGHLVVRLGLLAAVGGPDWESLAEVLFYIAGFLAYQLGIAFAATLLRRLAAAAEEAAREGERLRATEAVAERLHRDRHERYAGLDLVPLLTGLAAGALDPADERVRTRCAVVAGRMRRLFAERDDVPDPLVHELRACVDTAERRGVTVYFGTCGRRPEPPLPVRRALTEPVLAAMATARSHARVTVIGSPGAVAVHVVSDGDLPDEGPATGEVTVSTLSEDGRHWVEATWQTTT